MKLYTALLALVLGGAGIPALNTPHDQDSRQEVAVTAPSEREATAIAPAPEVGQNESHFPGGAIVVPLPNTGSVRNAVYWAPNLSQTPISLEGSNYIQANSAHSLYTVPAGRTLVITYFDFAALDGYQMPELVIRQGPGGFGQVKRTNLFNRNGTYVAGSQYGMTFQAGTTVSLQNWVQTGTPGNNAWISWMFSGYLR